MVYCQVRTRRASVREVAVWDRLRNERLRRGMSIEDAAREIGVSVSVLRRLESGRRDYRASELVGVARLYGCSPDYLLGLTDDRRAGFVS